MSLPARRPPEPVVHAVPVRRPIRWGPALRSPGAAVAAAGFGAGLLVATLGRRLALGGPRRRRGREVRASRSFLVDVHLLGPR